MPEELNWKIEVVDGLSGWVLNGDRGIFIEAAGMLDNRLLGDWILWVRNCPGVVFRDLGAAKEAGEAAFRIKED